MEEGRKRKLDDNGCEVLDDKPVALPARFKRAETLTETVRRLVAGEISGLAMQQGFESFDEADDFDVGDDYDPRSRYELDDYQAEYDIRHDDRYKRRPPEPKNVTPERTGEDAEPVRNGGKKDARATKRTRVDQQPAGGDADGKE